MKKVVLTLAVFALCAPLLLYGGDRPRGPRGAHDLNAVRLLPVR